MATPQHRRPPPPFPLPDHLLESILARLPPEDPSCLLRASLVCKRWRDLIYDPSFLVHLLGLRRAPQMLGFLHDTDSKGRLEYVPTSPFSFPAPDDSWCLHGYRHGRAVFQSTSPHNLRLLVVPFTGQWREVPVPAEFKIGRSYATVICAVDGCDHRNCHGGPFLIVLVFCDPEDEELAFVSSACVYSSETGAWGEVASTQTEGESLPLFDTPAVLVGNSLLYFLTTGGSILEYDLARHRLVWIDSPHHDSDAAWLKRMILVQAEDGGLGVVLVQPDPFTHGFASDGGGCDCLCLFSREVSEGGDAEWIELGVIYLEESLPYVGLIASSPHTTAFLIGFAEGANTVFVSTRERGDIFTVDLQSKRARKVYQCRWNIDRLAPILSSYTSCSILQVPQGEHHSLMAFSSSDEADGEEGGGEEDRAQLLFGKGLMAIENGGFIAAVDYLSIVLELRVARYGELSPECASTYYQYGRALLKKARKVANHFSIAPKSAPYEKAGEGTTSRADIGNSENRDAEEGVQNSNREYQEDRNGDSDKDDDEIGCNNNDSDLDLASKMLEVARGIVEKSEVNTVETFRILSALTEVCMEKRKRGWLCASKL